MIPNILDMPIKIGDRSIILLILIRESVFSIENPGAIR